MSEDNNKQMFKGDWKCSGCGNAITELPFEPDPERSDNLKCRDCFKSSKQGSGERKMHQGNWSCASCSEAITELPFEPRNTDNLKCRKCFQNS